MEHNVIDDLIKFIQQNISQLEEIKRSEVSLSITTDIDIKLQKYESPDFLKFLCLSYVHPLVSRTIILEKGVNTLLKDKLLLPTTIILRSIIENIAIFVFFKEKIRNYIIEKDKKGLSTFVKQIMYNSIPAVIEGLPKLSRIGKMVKATDEIFKKMPDNIVPSGFHFISIYDDLSNILHPNFHGTFGGLSEFNRTEYATLIKDDIDLEKNFINCSGGIPLCLDVFILHLEEFLSIFLKEDFI